MSIKVSSNCCYLFLKGAAYIKCQINDWKCSAMISNQCQLLWRRYIIYNTVYTLPFLYHQKFDSKSQRSYVYTCKIGMTTCHSFLLYMSRKTLIPARHLYMHIHIYLNSLMLLFNSCGNSCIYILCDFLTWILYTCQLCCLVKIILYSKQIRQVYLSESSVVMILSNIYMCATASINWLVPFSSNFDRNTCAYLQHQHK